MQQIELAKLLASWYQIIPDVKVKNLVLDSRQVIDGSLFVALRGHVIDGRSFIDAAIRSGAKAILSDEDTDHPFTISWQGNTPIFHFPDLKTQLSLIASRFYSVPSKKLQTIAVTGTNGKTTITQLIAQWIDLLTNSGDQNMHRAAVMGTVGNGFLSSLQSSVNTTSNAIEVQASLERFYRLGATTVAMEVSSHALVQDRVKSVQFDACIFSNLSHDHLDYHGTMTSYAEAKKKLFSEFETHLNVINADDEIGAQWLHEFPDAIAVSLAPSSFQKHIFATDIRYLETGAEIHFDSSHWGSGVIHSALIGEFNVMNLLLSFAALLGLGYRKSLLLEQVSRLHSVVGRMEVFQRNLSPTLIVDYAHTPDALAKALMALRVHCHGKLWCVFGCGGDRDATKRPIMAEIAEKFSDVVVLTDDNPRSEQPDIIVKDMLHGMAYPEKAIVIHNRKKAIHHAFQQAANGDVVLVAGKGHEDYQITATGTVHYSDRETILTFLETLG